MSTVSSHNDVYQLSAAYVQDAVSDFYEVIIHVPKNIHPFLVIIIILSFDIELHDIFLRVGPLLTP